MKLLLDTHVLVWFFAEPSRLAPHVIDSLRNESTTILVSVASWWELAIKYSIGRLEGVITPEQLRHAWLDHDTVQELTITASHVMAAAALPHHHRDPFDRLLLAQASIERATLVSADGMVKLYGVPVLEAQR